MLVWPHVNDDWENQPLGFLFGLDAMLLVNTAFTIWAQRPLKRLRDGGAAAEKELEDGIAEEQAEGEAERGTIDGEGEEDIRAQGALVV
jgi:hypothetical protein